jgi:hypothetical protein
MFDPDHSQHRLADAEMREIAAELRRQHSLGSRCRYQMTEPDYRGIANTDLPPTSFIGD